ncbi:hypothetical protein PM082_015681 [Marasmius tenuissimus]|nr:hypothetical protein PM082_015681 [Marasmius tenuissimus]
MHLGDSPYLESRNALPLFLITSPTTKPISYARCSFVTLLFDKLLADAVTGDGG